MLHNRENRRSPIPHPPSIPLHNLHIRPHRLRQINLVHNQQVTPRDPRPPLPRHLIPPRHVNDIDDEIRQLPAVIRRQIVAPALNQQQIRGEPAVQGLQRVQVRADVFAHGGVGAAAGLDGLDARGREGGVPGEELGVLAREDVVGDGGDAVGVAQGEAEGEHERGFAGSDGAFAGEGVHVSRRGFFLSNSCSVRWWLQGRMSVWVKAWRESLPTDSHREGSLAPISPGYYRHRSLCVGAGAVEYLV